MDEGCFFGEKVTKDVAKKIDVKEGLLLHISHAALDHTSAGKGPVTLLVESGQYVARTHTHTYTPASPTSALSPQNTQPPRRSFVICTLKDCGHAPLDLNFQAPFTLKVQGSGNSPIHVSGYWEFSVDPEMDMEEQEEVEEEEEEEDAAPPAKKEKPAKAAQIKAAAVAAAAADKHAAPSDEEEEIEEIEEIEEGEEDEELTPSLLAALQAMEEFEEIEEEEEEEIPEPPPAKKDNKKRGGAQQAPPAKKAKGMMQSEFWAWGEGGGNYFL